MTWKEAWKRGAQSLQKAGVEEYDLDAWYLLEHVTGITKASYYMEPEHPMHDQEEREYLELIRKRSTRIPLQHLTGVQEFMGLEFLVNEHVLIRDRIQKYWWKQRWMCANRNRWEKSDSWICAPVPDVSF